MRDLQADGFPSKNWPQVCTAIRAEKFLRANRLEIEGVDGPRSKMSSTVVVRYRVAPSAAQAPTQESASRQENSPEGAVIDPNEETPEAWAFRLTEKMRGLLKEELAEYGGGEAFLRWVRGYDEDKA
jgi:hypothetical protein